MSWTKHWTSHIVWGIAPVLPWCFASPWWLPWIFALLEVPAGIGREMWQSQRKGDPMEWPWQFSQHRWLEAMGWAMSGIPVAALSLIWLL